MLRASQSTGTSSNSEKNIFPNVSKDPRCVKCVSCANGKVTMLSTDKNFSNGFVIEYDKLNYDLKQNKTKQNNMNNQGKKNNRKKRKMDKVGSLFLQYSPFLFRNETQNVYFIFPLFHIIKHK